MNKNSLVYTVVFSFITAFFFVFLLSMADGLTKEKTGENARKAFYSAVLKASGIDLNDDEDITALFKQYFPDYSDGDRIMKTEIKGESLVVEYFRGSGLWGTITGILAFNSGTDRIKGLEIISHNETPGLGGRIDENWFKDQFKGEKIGGSGITVRKGTGGEDTDKNNSEVEGITGASLTSKSIETIVNKTIENIIQGGGN